MSRVKTSEVVALLVIIGVLVAGCGAQGSPTGAQTKDYRGTAAYVRARQAFLQASRASLAAGQAQMATLVARVRAGCPGALRGTPEIAVTAPLKGGSVAQQRTQLAAARLFLALEEALEAAQKEPLAGATQQFATNIAAIRWSDPRINDLVHTFAEMEQQENLGGQPDLCQEIRSWTSSGYRKLPAVTDAERHGTIGGRWMRDVAALGCGRFALANPAEVLGALSLYQPANARPSVREIAASEASLRVEALHARSNAAQSLGQALGIDIPLRAQSRRRRSRRSGSASPGGLPRCTGKAELVSETVKAPGN